MVKLTNFEKPNSFNSYWVLSSLTPMLSWWLCLWKTTKYLYILTKHECIVNKVRILGLTGAANKTRAKQRMATIEVWVFS